MTELPSSANGTAAVSHHSAASRPRSTLLSVHTIGKNDLGQPFLDRSRGDPENASKTSKVSRVSGLSRVAKLGSLLARAAGRYDEGDDDEDPALAVFFCLCLIKITFFMPIWKIINFKKTHSKCIFVCAIHRVPSSKLAWELMSCYSSPRFTPIFQPVRFTFV